MRRLPLVRPLLVAAVAAVAIAVPATPAAAGPCWKILWTEHLLYDGPPGPDIWVMIPTIVVTGC